MDTNKVDMYIVANSRYFDPYDLQRIRERLLVMDESRWLYLNTAKLQDPTTILIVSLLLGNLGIDRFLLGQTTLGIVKLLTFGGCGIWYIIDWFQIMKLTRETNLQKAQIALM